MPAAREGGWRPRPDEELLLQAALLPDAGALDAFVRWKEMAAFDDLDVAGTRLLPLLSKNLRRLGADDPLQARISDARRRSWAESRVLLRAVRPAFVALDAGGIPHLVLKGAALGVLHYGDVGLRPMEDVDVLVPLERAEAAIEALDGLGWVRGRSVTDVAREVRLLHSLGFDEPDGHGALDLHWRPLYDGFDTARDRGLWERSVPLHLDGIATRALDPTDQLFHVCIHGMRWNGAVSPVRWVADAVMVLRGGGVDWERLRDDAAARGLDLPLLAALDYLHGRFGVEVPEGARAALAARRRTPYDRFTQWVRTARPSPGTTAAQALVVTFADRTRGMSAVSRARSYPGYLRDVFAQESLAGVVRRAVSAPSRWRGRR